MPHRSSGATPWVTLCTLAVLLGFIAVMSISGHGQDTGSVAVIALIAANIPGLIAALYAEKTSRDIRNGTVVEKSREGTVKALADTDVVSHDHPAVQEVEKEHG